MNPNARASRRRATHPKDCTCYACFNKRPGGFGRSIWLIGVLVVAGIVTYHLKGDDITAWLATTFSQDSQAKTYTPDQTNLRFATTPTPRALSQNHWEQAKAEADVTTAESPTQFIGQNWPAGGPSDSPLWEAARDFVDEAPDISTMDNWGLVADEKAMYSLLADCGGPLAIRDELIIATVPAGELVARADVPADRIPSGATTAWYVREETIGVDQNLRARKEDAWYALKVNLSSPHPSTVNWTVRQQGFLGRRIASGLLDQNCGVQID